MTWWLILLIVVALLVAWGGFALTPSYLRYRRIRRM